MKNPTRLFLIFVFAIFFLGLIKAHAETPLSESGTVQQPAASKTAVAFPQSGKNNVDWVRLKSGEYLEGKILILEDNELKFDSTILGDIEINFNDITELYSPRTNMCLFEIEEMITVNGSLYIKDDHVIVRGEEERHFKRSELVRIVSGKPKELNYWSAKANLGLQIRAGNVDKVDLTSVGNAKRQTAVTRFVMDYNMAFGKVEGVLTTSNVRSASQFDYFVTRRFFITPIFLEYFHDIFQNIEHRLTPGSGLGYEFFDTAKFDWNGMLGVAYQYERYDSVLFGNPIDQSLPVGVLATRLDWKITKGIDYNLQYSFKLGLTDPDERNHHFQTAFEYELLSWLDFDITFIWDRVANPKIDANGILPQMDDVQLLFGIGLEFD